MGAPLGFKVFVYCSDPSHAPRRVAVTNFVAVDSALFTGWHEVPAGRGAGTTGTTIVADDKPGAGWADRPDVSNADVRERFELVCRKCRRPRAFRAENLYAALDKLRDHGASSIALSDLAANVRSEPKR